MHSLIVFASGTGTNTKAIIEYFKTNNKARVALIVTNKPEAGVIQIAKAENIPFVVVKKAEVDARAFMETLRQYHPSLIILAGYLWKVPDTVIQSFPQRIINIHPALLPAYGGKGMYGHYVHNAVISAKEPESGITIHYVNEVYDEGNIILQARCIVHHTDTAETLAVNIHKLEHFYLPRTIEFLLESLNTDFAGE